MNCPVCQHVELRMSERQGVEIDYCPQCRGVWLDRGELDKILERAAAEQQALVERWSAPSNYEPPRGYEPYKYKRRKSFLEELFD
ncbi:MAG: zf-TFIIB domain-containing protein [Acidobacteriota bacterium]|nr:zf-TFIIB domain-containing protein [Blastocatellia bacterium]MDW8239235.1 zf-TFIIB domain-containing protein [Acidobacteriota bacterium]